MDDLQPTRAMARTLETPRLVLRPYGPGDLDAMAEMFADAEVTAYTLLGQRARAETAQVLEDYKGFLAERGYGMLAIIDLETRQYLGEVGLFVSPMGPLALRYALARAAWGRGIATEASAAVIEDTFDELGLHRLLAGVIAANLASIRVVEKLGFVFDREVDAGGKQFNLYALSKQSWAAKRAPAGHQPRA
jgi:RimJ/RimL family protein N-acetyltransferase